MKNQTRAVTIAEVARQAGVSPATVSRILNGKFGGDDAVANRVRAVVSELAYVPSHLARSLSLGQTRAVGFVVPDLANPTFQMILSGFGRASGRDGYRALVADTAESPESEPEIAREVRRRCDALVLCAPRMSDAELLGISRETQPMIVLNRSSPDEDTPSLSVDYEHGIRALTSHLLSLGHRSFAYVAGPESSRSGAVRERALAAVCQSRSDLSWVRIDGGAGLEDGYRSAEAVLVTRSTAVIAFNDLVALGLLHRFSELGVSVPGDVSVAGFDDISLARYAASPLTTLSVPYGDLGSEGWLRLSSLITGRDAGDDFALVPQLVVRASTGAPPH